CLLPVFRLYLIVQILLLFLFFFSSRRRHTRSKRDWSSDVCSPDLRFGATPQQLGAVTAYIPMIQICGAEPQRPADREGLVEESRGHRLAPNAGASDVVGYLRAVSPDIPVSVEAPNDIFVGHYGSRAWLEKLYQAGREVIASAAHS